jgi:hypothetical protein
VKLAFLNYDSLVPQLHRYNPAQFDYLGSRFFTEVRRYGLWLKFRIRGVRQHLREFFDLIISQAHATVRRKGANLRQRFAAMD